MRADREEAIATAAYGLLEQQGFAGTTMQAIARQARASMETLYRWYGDKTGLFRALITRNADEIAATLDANTATGLPALAQIGPPLLAMLLGPRAVALNRAAAADPTASLGAALATGGRDALFTRLVGLMQQALADGTLAGDSAEALTDLWLSLLIGDLQIRRVTGALQPLSPQAIAQRADRAMENLTRLHAGPALPGAPGPLPLSRTEAP